jgi:hypothetical protein
MITWEKILKDYPCLANQFGNRCLNCQAYVNNTCDRKYSSCYDAKKHLTTALYAGKEDIEKEDWLW